MHNAFVCLFPTTRSTPLHLLEALAVPFQFVSCPLLGEGSSITTSSLGTVSMHPVQSGLFRQFPAACTARPSLASAASSRPAIDRRAPSVASASAVARPMPALAPVTRQCLPAIPRFMASSSFRLPRLRICRQYSPRTPAGDCSVDSRATRGGDPPVNGSLGRRAAFAHGGFRGPAEG